MSAVMTSNFYAYSAHHGHPIYFQPVCCSKFCPSPLTNNTANIMHYGMLLQKSQISTKLWCWKQQAVSN